MSREVNTEVHAFLFEMDGVLVHTYGHHSALQETVQRIGRALGFEGVGNLRQMKTPAGLLDSD